MRLDERIPYLMVLPTVFAISFLFFYPLASVIWTAFTQTGFGPTSQSTSITFNNFFTILFDERFQKSMWRTLIWVVCQTSGVVLLGLFVATLINQDIKMKKIFFSLILLPWILPTYVEATTWKLLLHPNFGMVNKILGDIGLVPLEMSWLGNPNIAMYMCLLVSLWKLYPISTLMIYASMQAIPIELYDASKVDGTNKLQSWRYITLPHLKGILGVVALIAMIWGFHAFNFVYMMTQGGPIHESEIAAVYIYELAFRGLEFGTASSAAVLLFILTAIVATVYIRRTRAY